MDTIEKQRVECLVLAQAFETYWAYYLQSDGQLFEQECRQAILRWLNSRDRLAQMDESLCVAVEREPTLAVDLRGPDQFEDGLGGPEAHGRPGATVSAPGAPPIRMHLNVAVVRQKLVEWAEGTQAFPFGSARKSRVLIWSYLSAAKRTLLGGLGLTQDVVHSLSKAELGHTEAAVRWRGHLPPAVLHADLDRLVEAASKSPTVVVVGDIRKSQDLMTYADDAAGFSARMVRFITTTRQLVAEHHGFFDKFTGDGFLVYFNEAICRRAGAGHLDCCLSFLKRQLEFSRELFHEWSRTIRKLSGLQVGLAIGADYGPVRFHDVNHHLVAVGEAIVWATRMSDLAVANEIAVNNLLFGLLEGRPGVAFQPRTGTTKAGEEFVARMLSFCDGQRDLAEPTYAPSALNKKQNDRPPS